ncbi:MAG: class I SAM-dependent methyltransferase, partial [Dehalococcoidia bacterium]|nr:class I SAM-dependent methyltransferase [Dehalococcoidia bacterium]
RLFAWIYDRAEAGERAMLAPLRDRLVGDLHGTVLEVGCGPGGNFPHYPADAHVTATDYSDHMIRRALPRAAEVSATIELEEADAHNLPYADASFDAVTAALVLCSIPNQPRALNEIKRVLKPGGELRLLEHVRSHQWWRRWGERAISPLSSLLFDGERFDRDTAAAVHAAGFEVTSEEDIDLPGPPLRRILLTARRPA